VRHDLAERLVPVVFAGQANAVRQGGKVIDAQRACPVHDTEVAPPEPLFLPKAELEANLLPPAPEPFSAVELI
ncbi:hypothetical protein JVV92_20505, partial [Vibrio cholerae O1]|uniref:hypothetical protein n=1 Tax=Vibrio cholerae TaxID=666 RepID=UPI001C10037F